jgi:hypothetical protein
MGDILKKIINDNINKLEKQEQNILNKKENKMIQEKIAPISDKIESMVPQSLKKTLDVAFYKAFQIVFEKGTKYIEKSYNKQKIQSYHNLNDYKMENNLNRKTIKAMDRHSKTSNIINASLSTLEGAGLGLIGMGLPDIPLFTAMILKTIYEIALSFGFSYELQDEKIYVLKIIQGALLKDEEQKICNQHVDEISKKIDNHIFLDMNLDNEIQRTSNILSDVMLTSKFVQGIPIVGVLGSITNYTVIKKISKYSTIKYKKRYLSNKNI